MSIPFFDLDFDQLEEQAVSNVLQSKWISMGSNTVAFEERFAELHGLKHGVALANCTVALHLALKIVGVGKGDEVIVPSLSFVATAAAVIHCGGVPVFADIESMEDWTISPNEMIKKITPRTKAIIPMHYGGFGANMFEIMAIAKQNGIAVVEDACHAPLAELKGQKLGSFGDVACYSFYSNKNISTGEGGMLITNNQEYAERAKILRTHGMTSTAYDRVNGKGFYDVLEVGYNYRMDDIHSAIGLVQLNKAIKALSKREIIANRYRERLSSCEDIVVPFKDYIGISANHVFGIYLKNKDLFSVREHLKQAGITTSNHYLPIHLFSCFHSVETTLPLTEKIAKNQISLPIYPNLSLEAVDYVCDCLLEFCK